MLGAQAVGPARRVQGVADQARARPRASPSATAMEQIRPPIDRPPAKTRSGRNRASAANAAASSTTEPSGPRACRGPFSRPPGKGSPSAAPVPPAALAARSMATSALWSLLALAPGASSSPNAFFPARPTPPGSSPERGPYPAGRPSAGRPSAGGSIRTGDRLRFTGWPGRRRHLNASGQTISWSISASSAASREISSLREPCSMAATRA